jgi:hypothetical protein
MSELQVALFVLIVLAIFTVPFFVWRLRSKKRTGSYDDDWEDRARKSTPPVA